MSKIEQTPEWRKPIIAVPLSQAFPQLGEVKEFRSRKCLFNHDRTKLFDVVSPKYQVVEHGEAVDRITSSLSAYFGKGKEVTSTVRSIDGGSRVMAEFRLPMEPIKIGKNDVNEIRLSMLNSYDRSWAFKATLGAYRQVCSNGAMIGEDFGSLKMKHVGAEDDEGTILSGLDVIIKRAPMLKDVWTEWADTPLEYEDALEMLDGFKFPEKYIGPVLSDDRFPRSKWDFYNDLTRFATHDTKSVRRRVEFDEMISAMFYADL